MHISRRTIATAAAGITLISWAGISAAQEGDPSLSDVVEERVEGLPASAADALELAEEKRHQAELEEEEEEEQQEAPLVEETELEEADEVDAERPLNHGYHVSEATKTCPESGPERGACISAVAQGDAGKPEGAGPPEGAGRPEGAGKPEGVGRPEGAGKPEGVGRPEGVGEPDDGDETDDSGDIEGAGKPEGAGPPAGVPGAPRG